MILDDIIESVLTIMESEKASALSLSKGGWEGWLQCELWANLSLKKQFSVERELPYPKKNTRCDLVIASLEAIVWIEIKAYGIFRDGDEAAFLDSVAQDVYKLSSEKPEGSKGLSLVVVPTSISDNLEKEFISRKWAGFKQHKSKYVHLFYLEV
jgi:hypothetical protein